MQVKLRIFRFDPQTDLQPHYDTFTVNSEPTDRVLDCLNKIRWEQDGSLAYRMSCAHGICGSDGMTINGVSALACQKLVKDFPPDKEILIEPLSVFAVVKDLVVDLEPFFEREKSVHPSGGIALTEAAEDVEHLQSMEERARFDDDIKCIMCGCCVAACPVNQGEDPAYVGPAAVVRAHRYIFDSRVGDTLKRLQIMDTPHGVWSCKSYFKCTQVCPKKIQITKHIVEVKRKILSDLRHKK
ncbi:MAG: succinate dehydrogenase/fumarate reductase iron-sulfur subunit [Candidatus Bathyarchaeia archaeon]|jgi:succinate dehydrogenase / fumarate reductase iron-sulfur subunit